MTDTQQPAPVADTAPETSPAEPLALHLCAVPGLNPWRTSDGQRAEMFTVTLPREYGPVAFLAHTHATEHAPQGEPFLLLIVRQGHEQADADALARELASQRVPTLYKDARTPDGRAVAPSEVFGTTLFVAAYLKAPQKP